MSFSLRRLSQTAPALMAAFAATTIALIGYELRHSLVEPEAVGALCQSATAPLWCSGRTGLIVLTQWNVLGWVPMTLALIALITPAPIARPLAIAAALSGGLGLALYNAGLAIPALVLAILRLIRLEKNGA